MSFPLSNSDFYIIISPPPSSSVFMPLQTSTCFHSLPTLRCSHPNVSADFCRQGMARPTVTSAFTTRTNRGRERWRNCASPPTIHFHHDFVSRHLGRCYWIVTQPSILQRCFGVRGGHPKCRFGTHHAQSRADPP
ncbi:hypothetical protein BJX96DRAFT_54500 [Aspergillus floccosus]